MVVRGLGAQRAVRSRRFLTAAVLCTAATFALAGADVAGTGLYNPIPADAAGDPQDLFYDNDALFAYLTSDIKGGTVCVVPENAFSASCDAPAWGGSNRVVGIGTVYTLVAGPPLKPGRWQLLSENSIGEPTGRSPVFTVLPCPTCSREIGAAAAQAFKAQFGQLSLYASATCNGYGIKDITDGDLTGINGEMVARATTAPYGVRQSTYAVATAVQFVAISAGFQAISFASAPSALTKAPEKAMAILRDLTCVLQQMEEDIRDDPPDPNFGQVEQPTFATIAPLGDAPTDALARSLDRQTGYGLAILRALERYQGALAVSQQAGVSRQTKALGTFVSAFVNELRSGADALRGYADVIAAVPELAEPVIADATTRAALSALYARVRADGFTAAERAELVALGYTATEIDGIRSQFAVEPADLPVGVGLPALIRDAADGLEAAVVTLDEFAREAASVGGRTNVAPVAGFTATPQTGAAPLAVQFTDTSTSPDSDPVTITWSFGDFGSGFGPTPTHTYQSNGTFVARETVCDAFVCSSTTKVITVGPTTPANSPPVANDDSGTAPAGGQVVVDVRANDSDPDGDPLRIAGATDPANGRAVCNFSCQYIPDESYQGPDSFEYTIADDRGGTDTATVSITVGPPANRPPQTRADTITTTQDVAASINVLANDTDPDGDVLSVTTASTPFRGTASCTPAGVCTFTPNAGFAGESGFTYTVSDGRGATAFGFVSIDVAPGPPPPNQPPVAVDDAATVIENADPVAFDILSNDSDPNGDAIYVSGVAGSPPGTLTCTSAGSCTYVPQAGFLGETGFSYTIADGRGGSDTAVVSLRVREDGRRPVPALTTSPRSGFAPVGVSFDARGSTDPDGEIVSYAWEFGDGGDGSGPVVSHTYTDAGTYQGRLTVTDDDGLAATLDFTFVVQDLEVLQLPICGDQDGSETPLVFNCPEYGPVQDVQLYQVAGEGAVDVTFDFVFREAGLNNELAVVRVDDGTARIDDLRPGEPGYFAKAFARAQVVFPSGSTAATPDKTLTFPAGALLMFVIGQGTTIANVAASNPENELNKGSHAFFSLDALNPDSSDHMMAYTRLADGRGEFGWEDLITNGGGDFNDIVYAVDAALRPLGQVVVTKQADQATSSAGGTNRYTISVANSATGPVAVATIQDTLPAGFSYVAGSTTGATTANPAVNGSTLTWSGPFVVPRGEALTLSFGVRVSGAAGTYLNHATATGAGFAVTPTGPTAPIEVTAVTNRPPNAVDDALTTDEGVAGTASVLANDSDPDGDALTLSDKIDGANGTVACGSGSCTYTPAAGFSGADSFTYTISDGRGGTDTATVAVTVRRVIKPTSTTYTGAGSVQYSDAAGLAGTLRDTSVTPAAGIGGKSLDFTLGTQSGTAGPTSASGNGSANLTVTQQPGSVTSVETHFAGDAAYAESSDSDPFTILKEDCTLSYTGPLTVPPLALTELAADLGEPDTSLGDRGGKTITFSVSGTADPTLRTFTATTGADGRASTLVALPADVYAVAASFAGDAFYLGCETAADVLVTMTEATAKVTGGGWISIAVGRTSFGFNAIPQADGTWRGQLQIRLRSGKDRFHAKTVSTLTSTRNSATWSGTGVWNGTPGHGYTVAVVDNGSSGAKKGDTIAIVITAPGGATQFTTKGPQALKGGNITVHQP